MEYDSTWASAHCGSESFRAIQIYWGHRHATHDELKLARYAPELVYVDADNRILDTRHTIPVQAA